MARCGLVALLALVLCAAPHARAQITDVVVVEPAGAPAPALIATRDVYGNVQQRVVSPEQVDQARCSACRAPVVTDAASAHARTPPQVLGDVLGLAGAPSPAGECPSICVATMACRDAVAQLCDASGGAFCLSAALCPMPSFCGAACAGTRR